MLSLNKFTPTALSCLMLTTCLAASAIADTIENLAFTGTATCGDGRCANFGSGPISGTYSLDATTQTIVGAWSFSTPLGLIASSDALANSSVLFSPVFDDTIAEFYLNSFNPPVFFEYVALGFAPTDTPELGGLAVGQLCTNNPGTDSCDPDYAVTGSPALAGINGTIGSQGPAVYYSFLWGGGAFGASSELGLTPLQAGEDSFFYTMGTTASQCTSQASEILSALDDFTGSITSPNLAAGTYCIGFNPFTGNVDPAYTLTFNTPVEGVTALTSSTPEPSTFVLLCISLGMMAALHRITKRSRKNTLLSLVSRAAVTAGGTATSITLSSSPKPSVYGLPVTLTAVVTPPTATGT